MSSRSINTQNMNTLQRGVTFTSLLLHFPDARDAADVRSGQGFRDRLLH